MTGRGIRATLFDLDGTLVDSREDIAASVNFVRASVGLPALSVDVVTGMIGLGIRTLLERALSEDGGISIDEAILRFRSHYRDHCLVKTHLYPGVLETIESLESCVRAVVTNKPIEFSMKILSGLGLGGRFGAIIGGDSTPEKKPHPLPVIRAIEALGAAPAEAILVGDSEVDVEAGRRAGVRTCAVSYGYGSREEIAGARPDHVIARLPDLIGLLSGEPAGRTGGAARD